MKINRGVFVNNHTISIVIATIILTGMVGTILISNSFVLKVKGKPTWKSDNVTANFP